MPPTASTVQVPPQSTGKKVDTNSLTRGANTVERQNISIADPTTAAALAAVEAVGGVYALRVVHSPDAWAVNHLPAAATKATISKAAGAAGTKHVCTSLSATTSTVGTAQTVINVALRDGATGAGTVLLAKQIILPANTTWNWDLSGLNIVGSDATAMTLEFSAAGVADSVQSVAMAGYDVVAP